MLLYKDILTDDEMLTDTFKIEEKDDCYFEVKGKMVTETDDVDDSLIGGNASAEAVADVNEAGSKTDVNVVIANRLVETNFTKEEYRKHIKAYSKSILEKLQETNPERVEPLKAALPKLIKRVLGSFKDWKFYMGESMNPDGMTVLLNWAEDSNGDEYPYLIYIKDGLKAEKL